MTAHRGFTPIVTIVGFHHARGPEVETWFGVEDGSDPAIDNEWPLLPFMALSDGAHASTEDFSYFTLRHEATEDQPATSLFGISCTRQLDANELINRPAEVTRSTVQKAVVVIADTPQYFAQLREKLSMVTRAWFAQRDFTDMEIIKAFQESLTRTPRDQDGDGDHYLGLSLREMIHEFKYQTLVLFKSCLLQPKMLFFGSRCERLCMMQFSLISLIPGLLRSLQDCADPELDNYEQGLATPTSLRTSDRNSLLSYMGLPLQIFGKGSLFGPYTPLQQLDILADFGTKSYIVGSTNSLLLQQRDRYSDVLVNLDETTISITSTSLRAALALSAADRRWIDFLTQTINDTWDETNPGRPKTMGYVGSEEFIRLQFEEYLLALVSSVKYHIYVEKHQDDPKALLSGIEGNPANDFGTDWVDAWMKTENFRIFNKFTDSHVFDIVEPRHPCAGGLTMEDVQRRLAQQVSELHLDERFNSGREVLGKHLATGQKKVSTAFNALWADMEAMREAQRQRAEEAKANPPAISEVPRTPDLSSASSRAGAYLSSWGQWASEKRKAGWGARNSTSLPLSGAYSAPRASISSPTSPVPSSPTTTSTSTTAAEETRRSSSLLSSSSAAHAEAATYSPPRGSKSESESRDGEEGSQSVEMVEVFDRDRGVDAEREEESQGQAQRRGSNGGIISAESVDEEDEKESNGGGAEEPDEAKQGERVDTH